MNTLRVLLRRSSRCSREQAGIILPLSVMLLAMILVLALVVAEAAVQSNTFSNKQTGADQALATAEAGLQGVYRRLAAGEVVPETTEGTVGSRSYTATLQLLSTATKRNCTGLPVVGSVTQRCITASATVDGVTRRVQERVISSTMNTPTALESLGEIQLNNTTKLEGNVTANGKVSLGAGTVTGTITASEIQSGFKCSGCKEVIKAETLGTKTPNLEELCPEKCARAYEEARESNEAEAMPEPARQYFVKERKFESSKPIGSEAAWVELPSGKYNFCEISFNEKVYLKVPAGHEVSFYIDSSERAGSKCSAPDKVKATNGFCLWNEAEIPGAIKIFVWGNHTGSFSEFNFTNGVGTCGSKDKALIADIYAPYTTVETHNGGAFGGDILAGKIEATNGLELVGSAVSSSSAQFAPAAWTICNKTASGGPATGCY